MSVRQSQTEPSWVRARGKVRCSPSWVRAKQGQVVAFLSRVCVSATCRNGCKILSKVGKCRLSGGGLMLLLCRLRMPAWEMPIVFGCWPHGWGNPLTTFVEEPSRRIESYFVIVNLSSICSFGDTLSSWRLVYEPREDRLRHQVVIFTALSSECRKLWASKKPC